MIGKMTVTFIIVTSLNMRSPKANADLETKFVEIFGNESPVKWIAAETMDESDLVDICENANIQAGIGSIDVACAELSYGILKLSNPKYRNMRVSILKCVGLPFYDPRSRRRPHFVNSEGMLIESECDVFYLTQGTRADSVLYLKQLKKEKTATGEKVFVIWRSVGGLLFSSEHNTEDVRGNLFCPNSSNANKKALTPALDSSLREELQKLETSEKAPVKVFNTSVSADKVLLDELRHRHVSKTAKEPSNDVSVDKTWPEKSRSLGRNQPKIKAAPAMMFMYEIPFEIMYP